MKLSRQNKIVVGVVALVLVLTVGYALFSQSLNIGGTASADGTFELVFDSIGTIVEKGSTGAEASNSQDKKTLTITVPNLEYPGAYVQIPAVIKNTGTVDAKLLGITTEGLSNDDMEVTYTGLEQNDIIKSEATRDIVITIKWKEASVTTSSSLSFNIGLNYEQVRVEDITTGSSESSFPVVEGQLGDNVYFKYDNGVINITGSGDMYVNNNNFEHKEYCYSTSSISAGTEKEETNYYCSLGTEIASNYIKKINTNPSEALMVILPEFIVGNTYESLGITKEDLNQLLIGEFSITQAEANEILEILDSVPKLRRISIEDGITSIRTNFFSNIVLDILTIPNSVTFTGKTIFYTSTIDTLVLGTGLTILPDSFITLPESKINSIIIPTGVTTIESYAIKNVSVLATLTIPQSITTIKANAISGCKDLTTIVNTTGRAFDWNAILGNGTGVAFETGSVELSSGQIINITK